MKKNILWILLLFAFSQVNAQQSSDGLEQARQYKSLGNAFAAKFQTDSMFFYYGKALDIYRDNYDTAGMSSVITSLGIAYKNIGFKEPAKRYFRRALRYDSLQNDYLKMAVDYQHWAEVSDTKDEIVECLKKSIAIADTVKDKNGADVKAQGYKSLAKKYLETALEKSDTIYADSCAECLKRIENYEFNLHKEKSYLEVQIVRARYLIFSKKYDEALKVLDSAQKNSSAVNQDRVLLSEYYRLLALCYEQKGDYRNSLVNYKNYDSCYSKVVSDSILSAMVNYRTERMLKHRQYKALKEEEGRRVFRILVIVGVVLLALLIFYISRIIWLRRRAANAINRQNEILDTQQSEINSQRSIISRYGNDVEFFSNQLYDVINYAEKIQKAAISSKEDFGKLFPENFVYYSPRDIAGGDFYRAFKCGKYSALVVGDCTGYGVKGAMLSVLCISEIERICSENPESPVTVIKGIRQFLQTVLPGNPNEGVGNGIDLSVLFLDFSTMELKYAAVNQNACILRNGEIIRLKGVHIPFGVDINTEDIPEQTVNIKKGDMLYAFTDGIQSQPGGGVDDRYGKKFLTKNLDKLLTDVCSKSPDEQRDLINKRITDWRKGRPQIDDITMIGVRL
ncbi:MAG: SpoIIE family protein phosphatase [Bacteroidales bacterium]|nr:SpoIIE family protein phosphatase [Bacteroidales bacterium]